MMWSRPSNALVYAWMFAVTRSLLYKYKGLSGTCEAGRPMPRKWAGKGESTLLSSKELQEAAADELFGFRHHPSLQSAAISHTALVLPGVLLLAADLMPDIIHPQAVAVHVTIFACVDPKAFACWLQKLGCSCTTHPLCDCSMADPPRALTAAVGLQ